MRADARDARPGVQVSGMRPDRLPRPLRLAIYAAAVAVVLYLSLAPTESLPQVNVWDKAEHALAWGGLTALGLALSTRHGWAVPVFTLGLGVAVEALQATLGFGRMGDWRDLVADAVGIVVVLGACALFRRSRGAVGDRA